MTPRKRFERSFNRWGLFAAMLCAVLAVWTGYVGRDHLDRQAFAYFAIITVATAYCLVWMLGRIIGWLIRHRQERRKQA